MKNALVLHGTSNNSQGNWFPWLKKELENKGWKVWIPDLPQADKPNIKLYNKFILANKDWEFDKDSVIIGHSSGAVAILGLLQHLPEDNVIDTAILVGSFKDNLGEAVFNGLFEEPFNFKEVKKHSKRFIFIHSDNDPYCPLEHAKYLSEKLEGELIVLNGQGHFNLEKGPQYKKFPYLLELLVENRISYGFFFPKVRTALIGQLLENIDSSWDKLLKGLEDKKKDEVGMTLHRFKEALAKLDYRFFDLYGIARVFDHLKNDEMGEPLHFLQIAFVDKVEAFHQQVYSTTSTLILVLNHLGYKGKKLNNPINSVEQFLNFVKNNELKYRSSLIDQIDVLQKSRDFRSKFIDHPQQHQLHDWMTFRAGDGIYLIFFKRKGNEVYMINPIKHPFDPDFKPPVNCGRDFYIAPSEEKTLKAVEVLVKHMLDL